MLEGKVIRICPFCAKFQWRQVLRLFNKDQGGEQTDIAIHRAMCKHGKKKKKKREDVLVNDQLGYEIKRFPQHLPLKLTQYVIQDTQA